MKRIRKVYNGVVPNGKLFGVRSESPNDGYNCAYLNNALLDTYSTEEIRIGTWIDGKPLYKKTIDFGYLPNATEKSVLHNISNLGKVIKVEQHIDNGSTYASGFVLFASYPQTTVGVNLFGSNTSIIVRTSGNESGKYAYFTLYYIKTTD